MTPRLNRCMFCHEYCKIRAAPSLLQLVSWNNMYCYISMIVQQWIWCWRRCELSHPIWRNLLPQTGDRRWSSVPCLYPTTTTTIHHPTSDQIQYSEFSSNSNRCNTLEDIAVIWLPLTRGSGSTTRYYLTRNDTWKQKHFFLPAISDDIVHTITITPKNKKWHTDRSDTGDHESRRRR